MHNYYYYFLEISVSTMNFIYHEKNPQDFELVQLQNGTVGIRGTALTDLLQEEKQLHMVSCDLERIFLLQMATHHH